MASVWMEYLQSAKKSVLLQDGRRKVHYGFPDSKELVEEYDERTDDLLIRKWRVRNTLGGQKPWELEIGEDTQLSHLSMGVEVSESPLNPVFYRKDTKNAFQWRIRNLPYSLGTYSVKVEDKDTIVVRTSNKKYFKRIEIPDMKRESLPLYQENLSFAHANNTLIIQYKKPKKVIDIHNAIVNELKKVKVMQDGDADCKPS